MMRNTLFLLVLTLILSCAIACGESVYGGDGFVLVSDQAATWRVDLTDGTVDEIGYEGNASDFYDMGDQVIFVTRESAWPYSASLRVYHKDTRKANYLAYLGDNGRIVGHLDGLIYYLEYSSYDGAYELRTGDPDSGRRWNGGYTKGVQWAGMDGSVLALVREDVKDRSTPKIRTLAVRTLPDGEDVTVCENAGTSALISSGTLFYTEYDADRGGQWIIRATSPWQGTSERLLRLEGPDAQVRFAGQGDGWLVFQGDHLADREDALYLLDTRSGALQTLDAHPDAEADPRLFALGDSLYYLNGLGELRRFRPEAGAATELVLQFPQGTELLGFCREDLYYRIKGVAYAASLPTDGTTVAADSAETKAEPADPDEIIALLQQAGRIEWSESPVWKSLNDDPEMSQLIAAAGTEGLDARLRLAGQDGTDISLRFANTPEKAWTLEGAYTMGGQESRLTLTGDEARAALTVNTDGTDRAWDLSPLLSLLHQGQSALDTVLYDAMDRDAAVREEAEVKVASLYRGIIRYTQEAGTVYHVPLRWDALIAQFHETLKPFSALYDGIGGAANRKTLDEEIDTLTASIGQIRDEIGADPVLDLYVAEGNRLQRFDLRIEEPAERRGALDTAGRPVPARRIGDPDTAPRGLKVSTTLIRDKAYRGKDEPTPDTPYTENIYFLTDMTVSNGLKEQRTNSSFSLTREFRKGMMAMDAISLYPNNIRLSHSLAPSTGRYVLSVDLSTGNASLTLTDLRVEDGVLTAAAVLSVKLRGMDRIELSGTFEMKVGD